MKLNKDDLKDKVSKAIAYHTEGMNRHGVCLVLLETQFDDFIETLDHIDFEDAGTFKIDGKEYTKEYEAENALVSSIIDKNKRISRYIRMTEKEFCSMDYIDAQIILDDIREVSFQYSRGDEKIMSTERFQNLDERFVKTLVELSGEENYKLLNRINRRVALANGMRIDTEKYSLSDALKSFSKNGYRKFEDNIKLSEEEIGKFSRRMMNKEDKGNSLGR